MNRLKLAIVSSVLPFPRSSGQQQRVFHTIEALRELFHITFVTTASPNKVEDTQAKLLHSCDEAVVLASQYGRIGCARIWHKTLGSAYALATGLKFSNYVIGKLEFSPRRLGFLVTSHRFDCVLFEYWHATGSISLFQERGIPCVLDMHDVLWQGYDRQLATHPYPWMRMFRSKLVQAYRRREEASWTRYDGLIAISMGEAEYARRVVPKKRIILAPMGVDLDKWPYSWSPARPPRLAFYGSLESRVNKECVFYCFQRVMPLIWRRNPSVEFWVVGASPPREMLALTRDSRVHVTGFIPDVVPVLSTMTAVLCPWKGTYGFRSRVIEVMALGVPVVATPDAVYGMGIESDKGISLFKTDEELAECSLALIEQPEWSRQQSHLARKQIVEKFGFGATYGRLAQELYRLASYGQNQG